MLALIVVAVILGAVGVSVGASQLIFPLKTEAPGTVPGKVLFFKGNGTGSDFPPDVNKFYDEFRSSLKDRFGERFIEVGYAGRDRGNEWMVLLEGHELVEEDIAFIRSFFPQRITLQIVGINLSDCEGIILQTKPPIIDKITC